MPLIFSLLTSCLWSSYSTNGRLYTMHRLSLSISCLLYSQKCRKQKAEWAINRQKHTVRAINHWKATHSWFLILKYGSFRAKLSVILMLVITSKVLQEIDTCQICPKYRLFYAKKVYCNTHRSIQKQLPQNNSFID